MGAQRTLDRERIGERYRVERLLGKGGMGAVYRVLDESTGRHLALKRMTWSEGVNRDSETAQLRFRREFHTMASLRHPHIVEVQDFGIDAGVPYYTMELLDGQDLQDITNVTATLACELLRDVAAALAFLHARRLIHRDLTPSNVRRTSDGRAKLIDFGVLASAGVCGEIAGTPPFIAPESLRGRPIDHRADLFGLGALAYRILTGRHAYPAGELTELEAVWRHRPAAPSQLAPDIPPALDELVLSLLALDPLARPTSAAEVIDRLAAIAGLDRAPETETAHGWLASTTLIGRQHEMTRIRQAIARAQEGSGRSLLIEAPSGTGKSRLLFEVGLEAQMAGMVVVRADGGAGRGPYGVFHELARGLLAAVPDVAEAAARPRARVLARVLGELRQRLGVEPAEPLGDPTEDRLLLQTELAGWFTDVAARRKLALLVDDLQRCDEASGAVLAALSYAAPGKTLLVCATLRTDETVRAPAAVASLGGAGQRMRLRGLEAGEVQDLCRALFGEVPHVALLGRWMHQVAGGTPLHCTELARHLVDREVIRYADGLWVIPEDPGRDDLPRGLAEAMDARTRALPEEARALGEALSIYGGEVSLDIAVRISATNDEAQVFRALDQLTFAEVLVQAGDSWRFRHDGLREALLRGLGDERRKDLHRRVGEALAACSRGTDAAEREAEIGWHLLSGGDARRGAALLERAGRRLYDAQSFLDCIAPLEAALGVLSTHRGSQRVQLELLRMLLLAGRTADRKTALRYADPCVCGYRYWAGLDVAAKAGKVVGRLPGLVMGLGWATLRWLFSPRRGPNPVESFRNFFMAAGLAANLHATALDLDKVKALMALVEPIAIFENRLPHAFYLLTRTLYFFVHGDLAAARQDCRRILEILATDRVTPVRDIDRKTYEGVARSLLLIMAVSNLDPAWKTESEEIGKLQMRGFDLVVEYQRLIYHRMRGEEELATEIEAHAEVLFVQLGSAWQTRTSRLLDSSLAYAFARDVPGLKRMIESLARSVAEGCRYEPFLQLARGEYLREGGDAAAALAVLEPLAHRSDFPLVHPWSLAALAETYLALGDYPRAREVAEEGVRAGNSPEDNNLHVRMRSTSALALAEAALGRHEEAGRLLEQALAEAAPYQSPLLDGSLHEARARVALAARDFVNHELHRYEADRLFRQTRNPALVARAERLAGAGARPARLRAVGSVDPVTRF